MAGRREFDVDALNDILAVIKGVGGASVSSSIQGTVELAAGAEVDLAAGAEVALVAGTEVDLAAGATVALAANTEVDLAGGAEVALAAGTTVGLAEGAEVNTNPPLDAFGRIRVSDPTTIFDAGHQYNLNALVWDTLLNAGTGTVTHLPDESAVSLTTGGTLVGAKAVLQTKQYHRYQPGKSQLIMMTGVFGAPVSGVRRRYGYFDVGDGLYFEQLFTGMGVVLRSTTSGSIVETRVAQADWNLDKLNGAGPSGVTVDWSMAQIFLIDLEWLGVGRVRFGLVLGGEIVYVHELTHINTLPGAYMATANLPIRAEIENGAEAAGANTFKQICCSVISEGGQEDDRAFLFSGGNGVTTIAATARRPIFSIRPRDVFNSITNRAQIVPSEIELYTDANAYYEVVLNGTLTNASFAPVDASNSVAASDTAATAITGGVVVESGYVTTGGGASRGAGRDGILGRLPLVMNSTATNGDILTVVVTPFTGTANVGASITWREFR